MHEPTTSEIQEVLQAFADSMKLGWKVYENGDKLYAGRRFEYRSGALALLAVQPFRYLQDPKRYMAAEPMDMVREWEAQINLPFSAGPEVSTIGRLPQVEEWVSAQEDALTLPLRLQECKSREAGEEMASGITSAALVLLAAVFDIDYYEDRKTIVRKIVQACVPAGRRP